MGESHVRQRCTRFTANTLTKQSKLCWRTSCVMRVLAYHGAPQQSRRAVGEEALSTPRHRKMRPAPEADMKDERRIGTTRHTRSGRALACSLIRTETSSRVGRFLGSRHWCNWPSIGREVRWSLSQCENGSFRPASDEPGAVLGERLSTPES